MRSKIATVCASIATACVFAAAILLPLAFITGSFGLVSAALFSMASGIPFILAAIILEFAR